MYGGEKCTSSLSIDRSHKERPASSSNICEDTRHATSKASEDPKPGHGAEPNEDAIHVQEAAYQGAHAEQASNHDLQTTDHHDHKHNNLHVDNANGASIGSETSSVIPTSERVSIATTTATQRTQPFPNINGQANNPENINTMLNEILANPGWSVAAEGSRRRNSLFSMRSLAATLPPYEEYPHQRRGQGEAGSSDAHVTFADMASGEKGGSSNADSDGAWAEAKIGEGDEMENMDDDNDPENALSAHYSGIVKILDSRYTAELARLSREYEESQASHRAEVARMRNDMDGSYRNMLKILDSEAEQAKEEAAAANAELVRKEREWKEKSVATEEELKEAHVKKMERARHEVEDVWERRWRDRMELVDEEGSRRVRLRDGEWLTFLQRECPGVVDVARNAMGLSGDLNL